MTRAPIHRRRLALAGAAVIGLLSFGLLIATVTMGGGTSVAPGDGDDPADGGVEAPREEVVVEATEVAAIVEVAEAAQDEGVVADVGPVAVQAEPPENSSSAPVAAPPFPSSFEPAANEVQADAKQLGAAVVYRLTNYWPDSSTTELAAGVTIDPERALALSSMADAVHHPGMWSRGTIEYAQLGGHLDGGISIMVVVHQELGTEGSNQVERAETRTMDVRLVRNESGAWMFDELASTGGEPVARPADLAPLAAAVVDDPRIDLPDSAIWDIYSGHTDLALLRVMSDLAERAPYSVVVLHTGHPHNVFGTDRLSNHTVGRAVDIYALDSALVIDSHDVASPTHELTEWLASRPDIKELGSPWRLEDTVAHTFTNEVHHDHLHVGVFPDGHAEE